MIALQEQVSLKQMNTFGVEARTNFFGIVDNEYELIHLLQQPIVKQMPLLVLGGGSNILFVDDFQGLTLKMNIKGISSKIGSEGVLVDAAAGENWSDVVQYCVDNGFAGIENLTGIPGTVGAAPVQNIGAYGVELKDIFYGCRVYEIGTGKRRFIKRIHCAFDYRDSIFKHQYKNKYVITSVTLKLSLTQQAKTHYGTIQEELHARGITNPSIKDVSSVVAHIRANKLPNPAEIGNAGSFFTNPIVTASTFADLKKQFPDIVHYPFPNNERKLAGAWLIEACGWKGKQQGNVATWAKQPLVIVNAHKATGKEILDFSQAMIDDICNICGIELEREVIIIPPLKRPWEL